MDHLNKIKPGDKASTGFSLLFGGLECVGVLIGIVCIHTYLLHKLFGCFVGETIPAA